MSINKSGIMKELESTVKQINKSTIRGTKQKESSNVGAIERMLLVNTTEKT